MSNYYEHNGLKLWKEATYQLYQDMLNDVFGEGVVKIGKVNGTNRVLELFKYVDNSHDFLCRFRERLEKLQKQMEDTVEYGKLLEMVKQVASPTKGEQAYAILAAWELMMNCNGYCGSWMEGFDVAIMDETTEEVSEMEALDFLFDDEDYDPYWLAAKTKDIVFKKFAKSIMDGSIYAVLVRVPWNCGPNGEFHHVDYTFYRNVARHTFMAYRYKPTLMKEVVRGYKGSETVDELSRKLTGLVIIDEAQKDGSVVYHAFGNPNRDKDDEAGIELGALLAMSEEGDEKGAFEEFKYDNY